MKKEEVLRELKMGLGIAEQEAAELANYFVATNQWKDIKAGDIDIVYGPKGSGKSALYTLLTTTSPARPDIVILPADNPRGTTVFKKVEAEPPTSEVEFQNLWKIYFATLIARYLSKQEYLNSNTSDKLIKILTDANFIDDNNETIVTRILRSLKRVRSMEGGIGMDANTASVISLSGKITLDDPDDAQAAAGVVSVDQLITLANKALEGESKTVWVAIDRLDIAFIENEALEENALRALFRVYSDIALLERIRLKIFLRTDIWQRLTRKGFREASHVARQVTINWPEGQLLNLIMRRLLNNEALVSFYNLDRDEILSDAELQEKTFYRIFPYQVVVGEKRPKSFQWVLTRTADATKETAPRELIQLLISAREEELRNIERGASDAEGEALFGGAAIKNALPAVSKRRLEQTLYAEYPSLQPYIEKFQDQKAEQNLSSLSTLWHLESQKALEIANKLEQIGFFEKRRNNKDITYWIPFLYRSALGITQGAEDGN